jgi:predicted DNA-binding transcriptional regulator AlpA
VTAPASLHSSSQSVSVIPNGGERGQLLTAEQLAERWQISTAQVYRLARGGAVPCVPLGRYRRFRVASIEAWEADQEAATND